MIATAVVNGADMMPLERVVFDLDRVRKAEW